MNIRKPTDYATMFAALDAAVAAKLPQMELYCEIGRLVSGRAEKGAAVAASEYLQAAYPAAEGFLPATCAGCGTSTGCTATRRNCWQRQCV
mgnify:CR=1 FL=1